ncbi:DUF1801 domain-containing protein [Flavobacterium sp.]|uniref:DUF1801 domain-containing protein n=1 Tax=Flavobacterium sp. TaxID=239 RepID=UPI003782EB4A
MKPAEQYILNQPPHYRDILLSIIDVMKQTLPEATLEYKWAIPYFYYRNQPFCYLNASHKKQFVDVGFAKGFQLQNNLHHLVADNGRNTVKSLRYTSLDAMDVEVLIAVIKEAATLY